MSDSSLPRPSWADLRRQPVHFLAFGFGSGLAPHAPGTFGTVAAIPLFCLLAPLSVPVYLGACLLVAIVGVWICDRSSRLLGVHDHPGIVWDEISGYLITMIPVMLAQPDTLAGWALWIGLGFAFFRLFDVLKPWPISWLDRRVSGGLGIMADDWLAGVDAAVVLYGIQLWQAGRMDGLFSNF